jgi:hypothetical protein
MAIGEHGASVSHGTGDSYWEGRKCRTRDSPSVADNEPLGIAQRDLLCAASAVAALDTRALCEFSSATGIAGITSPFNDQSGVVSLRDRLEGACLNGSCVIGSNSYRLMAGPFFC